MGSNEVDVEQTTALALEEKGKLIGYWAGRDVRAQTATIELPTDTLTAGGTVGV